MHTSTHARKLGAAASCAAILLVSYGAAAQEAAPPTEAPAGARAEGEHGAGEHEHHHHNEYFLGLNGVLLGGYESETSSWAGKAGGGAFFEFTVVPNQFEIEIGVHVLKQLSSNTYEVPIDVLFKKPYHLTPWFTPYWGVGPTFIPISEAPDTSGNRQVKYEIGAATAIGTYLWFHRHVGFSIEVDNNFLFAPFAYEVGGTAGLVFGW